MEVLRHREELDAGVVVVAFAAPDALRRYGELHELAGARLLSDTNRAGYAAFGFGRASTARVWLHPRVWTTYARLLARGGRVGVPREDTRQLGGDVLVDPAGRVRWVHRSRGPEDRPPVAEVLAARRAA